MEEESIKKHKENYLNVWIDHLLVLTERLSQKFDSCILTSLIFKGVYILYCNILPELEACLRECMRGRNIAGEAFLGN